MKKIISVDFDGTLCENKYPNIGLPNKRLISYLINCRKCGIKVILNTMREGELLEQALDFCQKYGLEFDAVNDNLEEEIAFYGNNPRKIYADWYVDDHNAAIKGNGSPLPDLAKYMKE